MKNLNKINGFVFGYPESSDMPFILEFAEIYDIKNKEFKSKELSKLHEELKKSDKSVLIYNGDIDETFEFYLQTQKLGAELNTLELEISYGLKFSYEGDAWSDDIKSYLAHIKDNYFICSNAFFVENQIDKMVNDYEDLSEGVYDKDLDMEKEIEELQKLKESCEEKYSTPMNN